MKGALMKNIIIATSMVIMVGLVGCKGRAPIKNVEHQVMPQPARYMSNQQIGEIISQTLSKRGIYCAPVADNRLMCSMDTHGHQAQFSIDYNQNEFSINHVSTSNMKESEGRVHPKYNKWIANVKKDILKALSAR